MDNFKNQLLARITENGREQTLSDHCRKVADIASHSGEGIGLGNLLFLCGLLHDLGKCSDSFQTYLTAGERAARGSVLHSAQGAVFVRARWYRTNASGRLAADLIAVAIASHHGRLPDLLNDHGDAYFETTLCPERFGAPEERAPEPLPTLLPRYFAQVADEAELDALFTRAAAEVEQVYMERIAPAVRDSRGRGPLQERNTLDGLLGLLQRNVLSALIDADRLDAYRFEAGDAAELPSDPPWGSWRDHLEARLDRFDHASPIARLRADISEECLTHADEGAGIYRLCVPTGGGKTFSVLRYALAAVQMRGMRRIVYAAPYKAILEQTAGDLREALGHEDQILEHHSDVTFTRDGEDGPDGGRQAEALRRYEYLTDRWDSPLVLTTTVQLLNTLFAGNSACVRRFSALAGSVIILDEAQCIPVPCWYLLMNALRYLTGVSGCAVVLCTATQPPWEKLPDYPLPPPKPLIADERRLHEAFRRVRLVDRTAEGAMEPEQLAAEVLAARAEAVSALCILNTKTSALSLHAAMKGRMPEGVPLYCLTTYQCPAHRADILRELRQQLKAGLPAVCVATQLIEAGVDVSFGLTVRALAGLESVTQAAGRCNRHGERRDGGLGEVWLVRVAKENLGQLREIKTAQERTLQLLRPMQASHDPQLNDLLAPDVLSLYFSLLMEEENERMYYPLSGRAHAQDAGSLFGCLCSNRTGRAAYGEQHPGQTYGPMLAQAFGTAGREFTPIEDFTTPVLVPYGRGEALIEALRAEQDIRTLRWLLREAQPYCVGVYRRDLETLRANHALSCRDDLEVYLLDRAYYRDELGLTTERQTMPSWIE